MHNRLSKKALSMKWVFLSLAVLAFACQRANFGFKNNPAEMMIRAHRAVQANHLEDLKKTLSRHALCYWGNTQGLASLKKSLPTDIEKLSPDMTLVESTQLKTPRFVGYWAYYEDVYNAQLIDKDSRILLGEARIECHFGVDGVKRESDAAIEKLSFPERNCKVTVLKARSFNNPAHKKECDTFSEKL